MDGTERPIRRPTGQEVPKPYYSGKKKGHRVKNIVVTDPRKRMLVLSDTFPGHTHDKTGANEQGIFVPIPLEVQVHIDLGFLGIPKEHPDGLFSLPEKKPKGRALSDEAKTRNREKARRRVLVEHVIGGGERFRAVADVLRNSLKRFCGSPDAGRVWGMEYGNGSLNFKERKRTLHMNNGVIISQQF